MYPNELAYKRENIGVSEPLAMETKAAQSFQKVQASVATMLKKEQNAGNIKKIAQDRFNAKSFDDRHLTG